MQIKRGAGSEEMELLFGAVSSFTGEVCRGSVTLCLQGIAVLLVH
jgi:hypothetical protein